MAQQHIDYQRNKIKNVFDFLRGREKTRVSFAKAVKVGLSPEPNVAGSNIHTMFTYANETHFDVNTKQFGRSVWRESTFEVITFKTQNWKQNFLDMWVRFFYCS